MKIAPYSILIMLLCATVTACKNRPETNSDSIPDKEVEMQPIDKSSDKKELPAKINSLPKEQKSDRRNHQKKDNSVLDTLLPKTA